MKIAVSQLIAPELTMADFFRQAKETGYEAVELSMRPHGAFTFDVTDVQLDEFAALSREYALPVLSVTVSAPGGNLLAGGEAGETGVEYARFGLACAKKLGAKVILHTLGSLSPELYYEDAYRNGVSALRQLAGPAEQLGVDFAVEFVWNGFLFSPLEMRGFLREVGSSAVGFYFDPGNMAVFQYPQHWVRALAKELKHVHLKDWRGRALNGDWTPLLEGEVNFPAVMAELHRAGYRGALVSEVPASLAPWAETAAAMRKIAAM